MNDNIKDTTQRNTPPGTTNGQVPESSGSFNFGAALHAHDGSSPRAQQPFTSTLSPVRERMRQAGCAPILWNPEMGAPEPPDTIEIIEGGHPGHYMMTRDNDTMEVLNWRNQVAIKSLQAMESLDRWVGAEDESDEQDRENHRALVRLRAQEHAREQRQIELAEGHSVWDPIDLTPYLNDELEPPKPDFMPRSDGNCLFYRETLNTIFGRGGSGKTMLSMLAAKQYLDEGGHVIFFDYEGSPSYTVVRLRQLGVNINDIAQRFHYISAPMGTPPAELTQLKPLVIVDATNGAITAHGLRVNDIEGFETVVATLMSPFTQTGGTGLLIDHVTNSDETGGRPIGSVQKFNRIQGTVLRVVTVSAPRRGQLGWSTITKTKDNKAGLAVLNDEQHVGYLVVDGDADGRSITATVAVDAPNGQTVAAAATARNTTPTHSEIIFAEVAANPGAYSTNGLAEKLVSNHGSTIRTWSGRINQVRDNDGLIMVDGSRMLFPTPYPAA